MKYKKIFDNAVLFFSLVCMAGFFWIFTEMFSGNLEKIVLKYAGYGQSNVLRSIDNFSVNSESAYFVEKQEFGTRVLFSKNQDRILPIASLTKLMSAIVVIDNLNLNQQVKITKDIEDWQNIKTIKSDETFFTRDLLEDSLIESNNSAIIALSNIVGKDKFIESMNKKALDIGLSETYFYNETGLDIKDSNLENNVIVNYSTAQDLVKMTEYILQNYPQIFEITKKLEFSLCDINKENCRIIKNTNLLLEDEYFKNIIIGGKTGETKNAGGCLILILKSNDNQDNLISVVLNSQDRFADTKKIVLKYGK